MSKLKKIFTNWKVILLLACIIISLIVIRPSFGREGVMIAAITKNSSAYNANMQNPEPNLLPMNKEVITKLDGKPIVDVAGFNDIIKTLQGGRTIIVETNKKTYSLKVLPKTRLIYLPELENKTINVTIGNVTSTKTIQVNKTKTEIIGTEDIGIKVLEAPSSNIRKGLDIQGGTRVILRPEREVTVDEIETIKDNMRERLNVYGLSDVVISDGFDLEGHKFFLIEIAGMNEEEVRNLIAREGKFEAKIGNDTIFSGGKDITYVCRGADCSGLDPQNPCRDNGGGQWSCGFRFSITLSQDAAKRQALYTKDLAIILKDSTGNLLPDRNQYLNETLDFYLDNSQVDKLNIGKDLKGRDVTDIQISGSGKGTSKSAASLDSLKSMKTMQTILITGSLPVKLEIVKTDSISPLLGKQFMNNALIIGLIAMIVVSLIIYLRYRHLSIVAPIIITMLSEVLLTLGIASFIGWNIDLAAIAGILVAVGTGVDDQIVITDEILKKETDSTTANWREKMKRAFFIVFSAYAVTVVGMIPLFFAGAGLLKGFAITTILGVTVGVLITRPAYGAVCEVLIKE